MHQAAKRSAPGAPASQSIRTPLVDTALNLRFGVGRKTPRGFFWVEWDPVAGEAIPADAVLVMAERK